MNTESASNTLSNLDLSKKDLRFVFSYLFRLTDIKDFRSYFGPNRLLVKRNIDRSGYLLKNCKLYAYAYYKYRIGDTKKPNYKEYKIIREDARLLKKLDLSGVNSRYECLNLYSMNKRLEEFLNDSSFDLMLDKFISKKMYFMMKSFGDTRHDLKMDMKHAALYNIYRCYPYYDSRLHMNNIGRGAAVRRGHSIIRNRAAAKNQRLMKVHDLHEHRIVDIKDYENRLSCETDDTNDLLDRLRARASPRLALFYDLMAGNYNEEFSAFLGCNNVEASHELRFDVYQAKVQKFLGIEHRQIKDLYAKLRSRYTDGNRINIV